MASVPISIKVAPKLQMSEDLPCPIVLHYIGQTSQSKMFDGENDMLTNCSGEKGGRQGEEGGGNSRVAVAHNH